MNDLPSSVLRARILLRSVEALPGAEERIYRSVVEPPRLRSRPTLRWAFAALGIVFAGSAAHALGLLPAINVFGPSEKLTRELTSPLQFTASVSRERSVAAASSATQVESEVESEVEPETVAPKLPSSSVAPKPDTGVASTARSTNTARRPMPEASQSELSLQVAEYRAALDRLPSDPTAALRQLEAHRRSWPNCAIRHEVDLRIVMTLLQLKRSEDARNQATQFLARYPSSPHVPAIRRIVESEPRLEGAVD